MNILYEQNEEVCNVKIGGRATYVVITVLNFSYIPGFS
jgi:hypothetical protein